MRILQRPLYRGRRGVHRPLFFARCLLLIPLVAALGAAAPAPFSAETVREEARALAQRPFTPRKTVPDTFAKLTYDQYRDIRFRPERAVWRSEQLPFQVQFFHPGFYFRETVPLHVVENGRVRALPFSSDLFSYGRLVDAAKLRGADGFAGFRLNCALNRPDVFDELVVFLGASYFRALGKGNVYGLSARGLAIDTALPSGEEFPAFTGFWIEKPATNADRVVVHALLDSRSITGAYRFVIVPGTDQTPTRMDVEASLFPRKAVKQLGLAPLTSMYLFGENDPGAFDDFRPEVHDSDGLFLWLRNGEQLFRPLQNPRTLNVSSFQADSPRAFGLEQRDRHLSSYEDLEAHYERRPSLWVEPIGEWGPGAVQLVEIPSDEEIHDNIVAAWIPQTPVEPGRELRIAYRLHWGSTPPFAITAARVLSTRTAKGSAKGQRRFVLDFSASQTAPEPGAPVEVVVSTSAGRILHATAQKNETTGGWRASFELLHGNTSSPIELRAFLRSGSTTLSETWSYLWIP
ncbi:MAG: glucan biosynthesis protein [Myxococcaceae bacterium]|nr:glucan biosynthesis protein [Myxococcaceae bacterium]